MSTSQVYIDLAIPMTVDKLFTYTVPQELQSAVKRGIRVIAPFGKRTVIGFIVKISGTYQPPQGQAAPRLRPITDIIDTEPVLSDELLTLSQWISEYYFAPWGEVVKAIIVQGAARAAKRTVTLTSTDTGQILKGLSSAPRQAAIVKTLTPGKPVSIAQLQKKTGVRQIHSVLNELAGKGYVTINEKAISTGAKPKMENQVEISDTWEKRWRSWLSDPDIQSKHKKLSNQIAAVTKLSEDESKTRPLLEFIKAAGVSLSTIKTLQRKGIVKIIRREVFRTPDYDLYPSSLGRQNIVLNRDQETVLRSIRTALTSDKFHAFLLHGITGSGKTQVYIEAIKEVIAHGKTAIVLVPEISLTPQIVRRFKYHFGDKVVALHSKMSAGERYDAWRLILRGTYSVVIGPRSAVFAPLNKIGLIVIDEEQESAYKQFDQTPRYHARDVAIMRASLCSAVVVMGSATPSLESYDNALRGKYTLLELPERIDTATLPSVEIVDMASERRKKLALFKEQRKAAYAEKRTPASYATLKAEFGSISELLREKIRDRLSRDEGIILLQNRRGFSPFIECLECGHVEMCDHCNISLTYHITKKHLRCHYCGSVKEPPVVCPSCKGIDLEYHGFGTQRVEEELNRLFPGVSMVRMDLDTTSRKGSHDRILKKFSDGEVNILLGTQMVAKGLDFSRVTLVGVISADTQMLLPDFRSAERTFQLLTQVAGRAGRSALAGEVVLQTYQPDHYSLKHARFHDFKSFYEEEIRYRQELGYPPFSRIVLIEFRGDKEDEVMRHADFIACAMRGRSQYMVILGPAPAVVSRLKGQLRWQLVIKGSKAGDPSSQHLHTVLRQAVAAYRSSAMGKSREVKMIIDVDPAGMM